MAMPYGYRDARYALLLVAFFGEFIQGKRCNRYQYENLATS